MCSAAFSHRKVRGQYDESPTSSRPYEMICRYDTRVQPPLFYPALFVRRIGWEDGCGHGLSSRRRNSHVFAFHVFGSRRAGSNSRGCVCSLPRSVASGPCLRVRRPFAVRFKRRFCREKRARPRRGISASCLVRVQTRGRSKTAGTQPSRSKRQLAVEWG